MPPALFPVTAPAEPSPANPVFSVIHPRRETIVGRDAEIAELRGLLVSGPPTVLGRAVAVQGFGGLGKTQLVVEYAYRHRDQYPGGVVWLSADKDVDMQLVELAELGRWTVPEADPGYKLQVATRRVREEPGTLVIFDNVTRRDDVARYLPVPASGAHVVITTRVPQPGFAALVLTLLQPEDALAFLAYEAGRAPGDEKEAEAARVIVRRLGGVPLALELAGAYLRARKGISWQKYQQVLQFDLKQALPRAMEGFTRHEADLYSALRIGEELFRQDPLLKDVLDVMSAGAVSPVSPELLAAMVGCDPAELPGPLALGMELRLVRSVGTAEELYEVHALIAEVRRTQMRPAKRRKWLEGVAGRLAQWFQDRRNQPTARTPEHDVAQLAAWRALAEEHALSERCRLAWLSYYPPYNGGRYAEAREHAERALRLWEESPGPHRWLEAAVHEALANVCFQIDELRRAETHARTALEIREALCGPEHPDTATALSDLAAVLRRLGERDEALRHATRALEIRERALEPDAFEIGTSANNIALIHRALGKDEEALAFAGRALRIYRRHVGVEHPYTATAYANLSVMLHNLKRYEEARKNGQRALDLKVALFGESHATTATSYHNMGMVYLDMDDLPRARRSLARAARLRWTLLGPRHTHTCFTVSRLAGVLARMGERDRALRKLDRILRRLPAGHKERPALEKERARIAGG